MAPGADADILTLNLLALEAALESLHELAEPSVEMAAADRLSFADEWHDALVRLRELDRSHLEGYLVGSAAERYALLRRELEHAAPLVQALSLEPVPSRLSSVA